MNCLIQESNKKMDDKNQCFLMFYAIILITSSKTSYNNVKTNVFEINYWTLLTGILI